MSTPSNSAIDFRERALAALLKARAMTAGDGSIAVAEQRKFDQHLDEARANLARFSALTGIVLPESSASVEGAIGWLTDKAPGDGPLPRDRSGQAMPLPGSGNDQSWYEQMRTSGRGFRAEGIVDPAGSALVSVPLRTVVVADARRARFVRELIPAEPAPGGHFAYLQQTARVNRAAAVAPLAKKPTSTYTMRRVDDRTRTIAHLTEPIPRQDIADAGLLRQFIDDELRLGTYLELDRQIVSADGSGEDMTGILESGIGTQAFADGVLSTTRQAVTVLQKIEIVPDGWAINPTDWEAIELATIDLFASNSALMAPTGIMERMLWSIPVMVTNSIPVGTALLGSFATSAILYETGGIAIDWSENGFDPTADGGDGASDFERNAIRFRAEGRWGLAVTRPLGFVAVDVSGES
jgi:HK97 family phage major capsid protein